MGFANLGFGRKILGFLVFLLFFAALYSNLIKLKTFVKFSLLEKKKSVHQFQFVFVESVHAADR
jgi:hypothetical protein